LVIDASYHRDAEEHGFSKPPSAVGHGQAIDDQGHSSHQAKDHQPKRQDIVTQD